MLGKPAQWQIFPKTAIPIEGYKTVVNSHIILGSFQLFTALLVAQIWMDVHPYGNIEVLSTTNQCKKKSFLLSGALVSSKPDCMLK